MNWKQLLLLLLSGWLLSVAVWAAPKHVPAPTAPPSFTTTPATSTVVFSFTSTAALQHWRLNGAWRQRTLTSVPVSGSTTHTLEMSGTATVGAASYAASPGVYLTAGNTYTLAHRQDRDGTSATSRSAYTFSISPVQDGSNTTSFASFSLTGADNYSAINRNTFTVPTDGVYHLVIRQSPFVSTNNTADRFADMTLTGPGVVLAPVAAINTAALISPVNTTVRISAAERGFIGLQLLDIQDPGALLNKVEYWATNTATQVSTKVGESSSPTSYSITWGNLPLGTYEVRAKLLNAQEQGALSATPLNLTVLPDRLSTASLLGQSGTDEVRAMVYQPDGTLVMAVNTSANPAGVSVTFLNGATAASAGALIRFSQDGRQVLSLVRLATQVVDLATDGQGRLYVAAGTDGAFRIKADLSAIEWHKTYPDQYVHRIDAGPQGHAVVLVADETDPDDITIGDDVRVIAYAPGSNELFTRCKTGQYTTDVAIDEVSQTVIAVGHKDLPVYDLNNPTPVASPDVPVIRGWAYDGSEKYIGYDWSGDPTSPRFLNRPSNNMANTQANRVAIGKDGKMYVLFMANGGNHVMRFDPFDIMLNVRMVGGDDHFNFIRTAGEPKTVVARYEPGTGTYLAGQEITSRIGDPPTTPNNRRGRAFNTVNGNITADAEGRVFITGDATGAPPLTIDQFPGLEGGACVLVLTPDFAQREAAFRVAPNVPGAPQSRGRAVAAVNGTTWSYGGSTSHDTFYASNPEQVAFGGATDGFYAVMGGSATPVPPPTVAIDMPISSTARPTISGTATPNTTVTLRGPASTTGGVASLTVGPAGTWSTSALTFAGGPNSVTAYASNAGGTSAPAVAAFNVPGTAPLPTVSISRPLNLTGATSVPNIGGTATANSVVLISLPGSATGGPISATTSPSGFWAASLSAYRFAPGPTNITVTATNQNGTSAAAVASFTVIAEPLPPVVAVTTPNNTTTISIPLMRGTTAAFAKVAIDGGPGSTGGPVTVTASPSGTWSASGISFPLGDNTLTITSTNTGGSSSAVTANFYVATTNSTLPPSISIAAPVNVTALNQPTLTGSATPFSNLTIIGPTSSTGGPVLLENRTCDCWSTADIWFPAGVHSFTVLASNEGGITTSVATFTVLGDVPPTLDITAPINVTTTPTPTISGTATPFALVTVSGPASSTGGPVVVMADASGTWSTSALTFLGGVQSVTAIATNSAGTSDRVVVSFRVVDCSGLGVYSVQAGDWTDPETWSCRRVPTKDDPVFVRHAVLVPTDGTADALYISYELTPE